MGLLEDVLKGKVLVTVAIGATALLLPKLLPELSSPVRSAAKSGLLLFLEAASEAEGGIIDRLAEQAIELVFASLSGPGSEDDRMSRARHAVKRFKRVAHSRSARYAQNENDRSARYRRHIARFRHGIEQARSRAKRPVSKQVDELLASLDDHHPVPA